MHQFLGNYALSAFIMKNRYGQSDGKVNLFINPIAGIPYYLGNGRTIDLIETDETIYGILAPERKWFELAVKIEETNGYFTPDYEDEAD